MAELGPAFEQVVLLGVVHELDAALDQVNNAGLARVLVISSTGKHFSAGMALDVFGGDALTLGTRDARRRLAFQDGLRQLMHCFDVIEQARFPVIAAIQGACVGGALDLACVCDLRVCSADAFFTVQEIHIGMAADLGVLQRLPKIVPPGVAREMAYTGERVGAERALQIGPVNAVLNTVVHHFRGREGAADFRRGFAGRAYRGEVAAGGGRQQAGDQLRRRSPDGRRPAADELAAKRDLRHRRDGHRDRSLEGQAVGTVRSTDAGGAGLSPRTEQHLRAVLWLAKARAHLVGKG